MIKGYYVVLMGHIVPVIEYEGEFLNPQGEVLIEGNTVLIGNWELNEGFRVDDQFFLWDKLPDLLLKDVGAEKQL